MSQIKLDSEIKTESKQMLNTNHEGTPLNNSVVATCVDVPLIYCKLKRQLDLKIKTGLFRISGSMSMNCINPVVIHNEHGRDIYNIDIKTQRLKHFQCDKNIWRMITISATQHLIIVNDTRDVHLIDGKFHTTDTVQHEFRSDGHFYEPRGLCATSDNHALLAEYDRNNKKTRFCEVSVDGNKLYSKPLCEINMKSLCGIMTMCPDGQGVFIKDTDRSMCTVNINKGIIMEHINMESHIGGEITSIYHDEENVIVGDAHGDVHEVKNGRYSGVVLKAGSGGVWGFARRGDKLVLTVTEGSTLGAPCYVQVYG